MDLSGYAKDKKPKNPAFEEFWNSAANSYRKIGEEPGNKQQALKKFVEFGFDNLAGKELARRLNNKCEDSLSKIRDTGGSQFLQHVATWLHQKEWAEPEDRYSKFTPPEHFKKTPNSRPMPKPAELPESKTYTKEERAKMQAGFKEIKKGVRKYV